MFLAIADNRELDGVARGEFANKCREGAGAADFDSVNFRDDVASFEAGFFGGAAGDDGVLAGGRVEISAARDREFVGFGDVGREVDVVGAEVGAGGIAAGDEVFEHAFHAGDRNSETDAVGVGAGRGVDADDFASSVDERAAGVASVDGGVGLNHVGQVFVRGHVAAVGGQRAAGAGDDAGSDSVLVLAEGVADSDDLLAGVDGLRVAEGDGWKVFSVFNFEESDVV